MSLSAQSKGKGSLTVRELVIFALLGAIMFASRIIMQVLPNIHLLGLFIMAFTVVYRKKALIPIYLYVLLEGITAGFSPWWIPYTYIWAVLWGVTMLLPRNMPPKAAMIVYPIVCGLHGLAFGTLYAPAQALLFGFDFKQTLAWIAAGLPFDALQAAGNLAAGCLVLPLSGLLRRLDKAPQKIVQRP